MGGFVGFVDRRRLLTRVFPAVLVLPAAVPVLGACSAGQDAAGPDLLAGMADAARTDAAVVAAAVAADPALRARLDPVAAARTTHADALDRLLGREPGAAPPAPPPPDAAAADLARVRDALAASAAAAADAVLSLAADEVGLAGAIAACCAAHAATLSAAAP